MLKIDSFLGEIEEVFKAYGTKRIEHESHENHMIDK